MRPLALGSKSKISKLHRPVRSKEDVLGLDVAVVKSTTVHVFDSADELEHEASNMVGLERAVVQADSFVEITLRAILKHQVSVSIGLEVMDQIDEVRMMLQDIVTLELLSSFIS